MIDVKIIVDGPGGVIETPLGVVLKALQDAGATVTVNDDHPEPKVSGEVTLKGWNIELTAKHRPWGG